MAITYTQWSALDPRPPWDRCSLNLRAVETHLLTRAGGQPVGCYGVRPIRGGTAWSSHAFGAAFDWRYANVGAAYREVGEARFRSTVLPWLIRWADPLGIQQLHDYRAGQIWRTGRGWKPNTGAGMGESWATYIHVECNAASWGNAATVAARMVPALDQLATTPPPTPGGIMGTNPVTFDHVTLSTATPGPDAYVESWQGILNALSGSTLKLDGHYGPATKVAVENVQRWCKLTVDGVIGPQTARALLDR